MVGTSEAEARRLISASDLYGCSTRRMLKDAGIEDGMSVLDYGTGAGDVALMLGGMVGKEGLNITAAATDQNGNTREFWAPRSGVWQ
jgi:ubiquinone/menaquinone biosynthesis C-methylase UbiE